MTRDHFFVILAALFVVVSHTAAQQPTSAPSLLVRRQNGCSYGNIVGNKLAPASGCGSEEQNESIDSSVLSSYSAEGRTLELGSSNAQNGFSANGQSFGSIGGDGNVIGNTDGGAVQGAGETSISQGGDIIGDGGGGVSVSRSLVNGNGIIVSASGGMTTTLTISDGNTLSGDGSTATTNTNTQPTSSGNSGQNGAIGVQVSTFYALCTALSVVVAMAVVG